MKRIGSFIPPIINGLGIGEAVRTESLQREWQDIFSEPLSLHTWPANLENHTLTINVDSPVWLQQLSFFRNEIISKLNIFEVRAIRFRLGKIYQPALSHPARQAASFPLEVDEKTACYIDETVSKLSDPEVQDVVRKAMKRSLARKKK